MQGDPLPRAPRIVQSTRQRARRAEEKVFKPQGGHGRKGRPHPYTLSGSQPGATPGAKGPHPVDNASAGGSPYKYWNEDALSRWLGPENLGWAILDGIRTWVLVDNGTRVNSVMPAYVCQHGLGVHPISELDHSLNPLRKSHSTSRAGQWMCEACQLHSNEGADRGDAPL